MASAKYDFFENSQNKKCSIISCELKANGCKTMYDDKKLMINSNDELIYQGTVSGSTVEACIQCTNGA